MAYRCNQKEFDSCLLNFATGNKIYIIERKRGRRSMFMNGRAIMYSHNPFSIKLKKSVESQVVTLFGNVKKAFNKYLLANALYVKPIPQIHGSCFRNHDLYRSLPVDAPFDIIDANHCFWRIAFLLGYISKRLYENTLKKKDMKLFRNMSLSCTIAPKIREYYRGATKIWEISEDTTQYQTMYKNIRYTSYNSMGEICKYIGVNYCLQYRTDGIFVLPEMSKEVKKFMRKLKLPCKTIRCHKVDDRHYRIDDEVKRF